MIKMELVSFQRRLTELSHLFHYMRTEQEGAIYEPECRPSPGTNSTGALFSDFSASKTMRNTSLLFRSYLIIGVV